MFFILFLKSTLKTGKDKNFSYGWNLYTPAFCSPSFRRQEMDLESVFARRNIFEKLGGKARKGFLALVGTSVCICIS